jgi:hypothetical protein
VSAPKARFLGWSPKTDRRRRARSGDQGGPGPQLPWKIDQFVLASPFRSWSLATVKRPLAQARKAAPAGGPNGTKSGGSITPKSGGPIQTKSGGSNHPKSCTHCCLSDLANNRTPYGRRDWQESWCTICTSHGTALMLRSIAHAHRNRSSWSHATLKRDGQYLAANRYRDLKVPLQPAVRSTVLGCPWELERATAAAIAGVAPNSWVWGTLTPQEFLMILRDLTTWALAHFEPVRSWSAAEDLTATEEQEGYGLIGRSHRMSASDYRDDQSTRSLREIANPKVRPLDRSRTHGNVSRRRIGSSVGKNHPGSANGTTFGVCPGEPPVASPMPSELAVGISAIDLDQPK